MSKSSRKNVDREECKSWIGRPVAKISGKPFKSGNKVNIVKDVVEHPTTGNLAFTFLGDDSIVEARQCCLTNFFSG